MTYELVFTICSIVQGAHCRELPPVPLQEPAMLVGCLIASQVEAAKLAETHPNFYLQRSACQPAGAFRNL